MALKWRRMILAGGGVKVRDGIRNWLSTTFLTKADVAAR